jgi:MFS family permease
LRPLLTTPVLLCFGYFLLVAMALTGLQSFAIPALMDFSQVTLTSATMALTCYFLGNTVGTLTGGFAASWTKRHDIVAASGMCSGALLFFLIASGLVVAWWVIPVFALAGFTSGITGPSRDLIVRGATAKGATGRVYGFVYSGLDTGSALAPVMLGWLLDHGHAYGVFLFISVALLLGVGTVIQVRQRTAAPVAPRSA